MPLKNGCFDNHKLNQISDWGNCDNEEICNIMLKTTNTVSNDSNLTLC